MDELGKAFNLEKCKKETITLKGNGYFDLGDHLALTSDLPGEIQS